LQCDCQANRDAQEEEERNLLQGHTDIVTGFAALDQLDCLVSASIDSTLRMWNMTTGKTFLTLRGHTKVRRLLVARAPS
jgi:WD40 repeat protein